MHNSITSEKHNHSVSSFSLDSEVGMPDTRIQGGDVCKMNDYNRKFLDAR